MRGVLLLGVLAACDLIGSEGGAGGGNSGPPRHIYCCVEGVEVGDELRLVMNGSEMSESVVETRTLRAGKSPGSISTVTPGEFPKIAAIADRVLLMWSTTNTQHQLALLAGTELASTPIAMSGALEFGNAGQRFVALDRANGSGKIIANWISRDGALDGSETIDDVDKYLDATLAVRQASVFAIVYVRGRFSATHDLRVARWSADGQRLADVVVATWGTEYSPGARIGEAADGSLLLLYRLDGDQPARAARIAPDGTIEDQLYAAPIPSMIVSGTSYLAVDSDYASGMISAYLLDVRGNVVGTRRVVADLDTNAGTRTPTAFAWGDGFAIAYPTRDAETITRLDASVAPVETDDVAEDYNVSESGCSTSHGASPLLLVALLLVASSARRTYRRRNRTDRCRSSRSRPSS